MAVSPPGSEIVGVVVGALALFGLISIFPVLYGAYMVQAYRSTSVIAWHRRRGARNGGRASPSPVSTAMPMPMQQVPLTHWLEQQQYIPNSSEHRYSTQDTCTICLSPLVFRSSQPDLTAMIPTPEPAWIPATHPDHYPQDNEHTFTDTDDRLSPRPPEEIRVLNRCNHAFHAYCLASWFQYGQFRCPICQASYSPV